MATVPVFAMTMERQSRFRPIAHGRVAVIDDHHKLTLRLDAGSPPPTLFDVAADLAEATDLAPQRPDAVARLSALVTARIAAAEAARQAAAR